MRPFLWSQGQLSGLLWVYPPSSPSSEVRAQRMSRLAGLFSGVHGKLLGGPRAPVSTGGPQEISPPSHCLSSSCLLFTANVGPSTLGLPRQKDWEVVLGRAGLGPSRLLLHKMVLSWWHFHVVWCGGRLTGEPLLPIPANFRAAVTTKPDFMDWRKCFHGAWTITLGLVLRLEELEFKGLGNRVRQPPPRTSGGQGRGIRSARWVKCRAQCLAYNPYTPSLLTISLWRSLFTAWVLAHNRSSVNIYWEVRFESPTTLTQLPTSLWTSEPQGRRCFLTHFSLYSLYWPMITSDCPHELEEDLCPGNQLLGRIHHQSRLGAGPGTVRTVSRAASRPSEAPGTENQAPGRCSQMEVLAAGDPPFPGSAQSFPGSSQTRSRQEPPADETNHCTEPGASSPVYTLHPISGVPVRQVSHPLSKIHFQKLWELKICL